MTFPTAWSLCPPSEGDDIQNWLLEEEIRLAIQTRAQAMNSYHWPPESVNGGPYPLAQRNGTITSITRNMDGSITLGCQRFDGTSMDWGTDAWIGGSGWADDYSGPRVFAVYIDHIDPRRCVRLGAISTNSSTGLTAEALPTFTGESLTISNYVGRSFFVLTGYGKSTAPAYFERCHQWSNSLEVERGTIAVVTYVTSTMTSGGSGFATDSTQSWTTNEWANDKVNITGSGNFTITSNTATTVSFTGTGSTGAYTIQSVPVGAGFIIDATKKGKWTTNQWVGYHAVFGSNVRAVITASDTNGKLSFDTSITGVTGPYVIVPGVSTDPIAYYEFGRDAFPFQFTNSPTEGRSTRFPDGSVGSGTMLLAQVSYDDNLGITQHIQAYDNDVFIPADNGPDGDPPDKNLTPQAPFGISYSQVWLYKNIGQWGLVNWGRALTSQGTATALISATGNGITGTGSGSHVYSGLPYSSTVYYSIAGINSDIRSGGAQDVGFLASIGSAVSDSSGYVDLPSGGSADIWWGFTRKVPKEFANVRPARGFSPVYNSGPPDSVVDPPTNDNPGSWLTRPASSHYNTTDRQGYVTESTQSVDAFVSGDLARYAGGNVNDPAIQFPFNIPFNDARQDYFNEFVEAVKTSDNINNFQTTINYSGTVTTSDKCSITTGINLYYNGIMITHSGTAASGSSTSLTVDITTAATSFFTDNDDTNPSWRGRWKGWCVEVNVGDGSGGDLWRTRVITSHSAGTLGWADALTDHTGTSISASGLPWRLREPYNLLNFMLGESLVVTPAGGGSPITVTVTGSTDNVLLFAGRSTPFAVGSTWKITMPLPGTIMKYDGSKWTIPDTGANTQRKLVPDEFTRYGFFTKGDSAQEPKLWSERKAVIALMRGYLGGNASAATKSDTELNVATGNAGQNSFTEKSVYDDAIAGLASIWLPAADWSEPYPSPPYIGSASGSVSGATVISGDRNASGTPTFSSITSTNNSLDEPGDVISSEGDSNIHAEYYYYYCTDNLTVYHSSSIDVYTLSSHLTDPATDLTFEYATAPSYAEDTGFTEGVTHSRTLDAFWDPMGATYNRWVCLLHASDQTYTAKYGDNYWGYVGVMAYITPSAGDFNAGHFDGLTVGNSQSSFVRSAQAFLNFDFGGWN